MPVGQRSAITEENIAGTRQSVCHYSNLLIPRLPRALDVSDIIVKRYGSSLSQDYYKSSTEANHLFRRRFSNNINRNLKMTPNLITAEVLLV